MTTVRCVLGPDVPVSPEALARFRDLWAPAIGADLVPIWCASEDEVVSRALAAGDHAGTVVDPGVPATREMLEALSSAGAPTALVSTRMPTTCLGDGEPESVF